MKSTVGLTPEFNMLNSQDLCRTAGFRYTNSSGFVRGATVPALFPGGQEDSLHYIPRAHVLAQCAAAPEGLVIGMGTQNENAAHRFGLHNERSSGTPGG